MTTKIVYGDCRELLRDYFYQADLIMTSPPYADARKKHYDSVGPADYPDWFATFHESFWQALKPNGSLVINIKDKIINGSRYHYVWKVIERLNDFGWYCIDDYIWHKTNPMPGRWPTRLRDAWEYVFHLSKSKKPYFNVDAVRIPIGSWLKKQGSRTTECNHIKHMSETGSGFGVTKAHWYGKETVLPTNVLRLHCVNRNVGHPAAFPEQLPEFFIKLLTPKNGFVIDPFSGSGTTGLVAARLGRRCLLIDNKKEYCELSKNRLDIYKLKNPHKSFL